MRHLMWLNYRPRGPKKNKMQISTYRDLTCWDLYLLSWALKTYNFLNTTLYYSVLEWCILYYIVLFKNIVYWVIFQCTFTTLVHHTRSLIITTAVWITFFIFYFYNLYLFRTTNSSMEAAMSSIKPSHASVLNIMRFFITFFFSLMPSCGLYNFWKDPTDIPSKFLSTLPMI